MSRLNSLFIYRCGRLDDLPSELWCLSELKKVQVTEPSEQLAHILQNLELNNGIQLDMEDDLDRIYSYKNVF